MFGFRTHPPMPTAETALNGRDRRPFEVPASHRVLGTPLEGPWPEGTEVLYVAMGCFWGAERIMWRLPGVVTTAAGYMGGFTEHPTYEETCTGRTGHAEVVLVVFDPAVVTLDALLGIFWEHHDPTQGMRQGNDLGSQYRSAIFTTTGEQLRLAQETKDAYEPVLVARGYGPISTEIAPADGLVYHPAEAYHQRYLEVHPHGYRCHAKTGIPLPVPA